MKPTRRAMLAALAGAPVAAKVAPQAVELSEPSGMVCRFYSEPDPTSPWTQANMNWYRSQMVESMGLGSLMRRSPEMSCTAFAEKWRA